MSNIRLDLGSPVYDGQTLTFKSPADCSQVTGLIVYYQENDSTVSKIFQFADAHGNNVGSVSLFAENVLVKVILDTELSRAYVQNADTNAYLEGKFNMCAPLISRGVFTGDIDIIDNDENLHDNSVVFVDPDLGTNGLPYERDGFLETITSQPGITSMQNLTFTNGVKCHRQYLSSRGGWKEWEFELDTLPAVFDTEPSTSEYRLTQKFLGIPMFARFVRDVFSDDVGAISVHGFPGVAHLHIAKCLISKDSGLVYADYSKDSNLSVIYGVVNGTTPTISLKYNRSGYVGSVTVFTVFLYTKPGVS